MSCNLQCRIFLLHQHHVWLPESGERQSLYISTSTRSTQRCSKSMLCIVLGIVQCLIFFRSATPLDISKHTVLKSSHQRSIRKQVLEQMRVDEVTLEQIWPKKDALHHIKWSGSYLCAFGDCDPDYGFMAAQTTLRYIRLTECLYSFSRARIARSFRRYGCCINVCLFASATSRETRLT